MKQRIKLKRIKNERINAYSSYQRQLIEKQVQFSSILPKQFNCELIEENGKFRYKHHTYVFQEAALSFADRVNYKTTYFFVAKTGFLFFDSFVMNVANLANTLRNAVRQRDYVSKEGEYLEGFEVMNLAAFARFVFGMKACLKMVFQLYRFTKGIKMALRDYKQRDNAIIFHDVAMPAAFELHCYSEYQLQVKKYGKSQRTEEETNQRLFHCTMRDVYFKRGNYQALMDNYLQIRREKRDVALERFKKTFFSNSEQPITENDLELDDEMSENQQNENYDEETE